MHGELAVGAVYVGQGVVLGFAAGVTPGPTLGLVISQTLRYGWRGGNLVALAPLFSDFPIIVLIVLALKDLPANYLHALSIIGGLFVLYLGSQIIRGAPSAEVEGADVSRDRHILVPAVAANLMNPHPYLFWATVGGALLVRSFSAGGIAVSIAFLAAFYLLLVGSKMTIAFIVSRSRAWIRGRMYHGMLATSGVLLIGIGVLLIWEGATEM